MHRPPGKRLTCGGVRVHRQRTQNYIKTLESEVIRLRESEGSLMQEKEKLLGQRDILANTLILSNIPLPPGIDPLPTPENQTQQARGLTPATVSYHRDKMSHERLHVNWKQPPARSASLVAHNFAAQHYHSHPSEESQQNFPDGTSASRCFVWLTVNHQWRFLISATEFWSTSREWPPD